MVVKRAVPVYAMKISHAYGNPFAPIQSALEPKVPMLVERLFALATALGRSEK